MIAMRTKRLAIVAATVTALAAVSAVVALAAGGGGSWSSGAGMMGGRYVYRPAQPIQVHTLAAARSDAQQFANRLGLRVDEVMQFQRNFYAKLIALDSHGILAIGCCFVSSQQAPGQASAKGSGPEAHLGKGYDALKQDQYDIAISEFRAALEIDSTLTLRARFPLAVALFEAHKSDEARRELEIVRREVGDHPNVLYYLGRLDLDDRNLSGAIKNLSQAAAEPPFPDTSYYLGFAHFKQGDLPAAEKWLKEAAQLNPRDARIPYQLGLVYRKLGRNEEAAKALAVSEELRKRDSSESQLRVECAQKLDKGTREEAHAICEQLYDPDNAEKLTSLWYDLRPAR